jgi:hypothetical protein
MLILASPVGLSLPVVPVIFEARIFIAGFTADACDAAREDARGLIHCTDRSARRR